MEINVRSPVVVLAHNLYLPLFILFHVVNLILFFRSLICDYTVLPIFLEDWSLVYYNLSN